MRTLMAALVVAATFAALAPASAKSGRHHKHHVSLDRSRLARWPAGWQNIPMENRGGACPDGDCGLLKTRA